MKRSGEILSPLNIRDSPPLTTTYCLKHCNDGVHPHSDSNACYCWWLLIASTASLGAKVAKAMLIAQRMATAAVRKTASRSYRGPACL